MRNSLRILLVVGVIMCVIPIAVSAGPITDADVSIDFIINDGDSADLHDDNGWLVAGSGLSSTIRVTYTGSGSPGIHFVKYTSLEKDTYGDVMGDTVTSMPYDMVFSESKNTAGNAPILVQINYTADEIGYDYYRTVYQPIDHATPKNIQNIAFESEVTLDTAMDITMTMKDVYGNTVTSLYETATGGTPEGVTFTTTQYAGSGFFDGTGYDAESLRVPVTADGSAVAKFKVGTEAGPKYLIHVVPDKDVNDKWLTITALADGEPYAIMVSVVPNVGTPPYLPADGESRFYLTYNLVDQYGNPSGNQTVYFNDSVIGDGFTQRTNSEGQIMITFGPFDWMGTYTIHAEAVENPSVAIDQVIRFTNTSPEEILLTANPQSMPSADVATATGADLLAKVTDESGNGVAGEVVSFFLVDPPSGYSAAHVADPALDAATALTNIDGIATMHFTAGAFETDSNDVNYNATASESCTVLAMWGTKTRAIDLEWKNYPYLRVETEVNPVTVEVGDPVDVTVRLIGDGWALYPYPIDVILSVDRSGSMLINNPDRMVSLMGALKTFNGEMTEGRDAVGMTSFGAKGTANIYTYYYDYWAGNDYTSYDDGSYISTHYTGNGKSYSDYATLDLPLSTNRDAVETIIDGLVPMSGTPMRGGLYLAIKQIIENGRDDAVQAVILLSDGDYNYYGDPLARGSGSTYYPSSYSTGTYNYYRFGDLSYAEQDLSVYASNNNITLYSIAFGDGLSSNGVTTLRNLAENTGGTYYHAPTGDDLAVIYTDIAGNLRTEAGVNTEMDVMFENIELNNVSQANSPADPILEYVYEAGVSTLVKSWNSTGSEGSPNIMGPLTLDQTDDWAVNRSLNFDSSEIGTIHLGQTWQAVFRMDVLKAGNINIFGDGSAIFFNDGEDSLTLPNTYITAVDNLTAIGIDFSGLQVYDLVCAEAENGDVIENYLTMNWNLDYSGANTATQYLYYQKVDDGIWTTFGEIPVTGPVSGLSHTRKLYVADFPPGEYNIRVRAMADDAPDSIIETPYTIVIGQGGQYFIRLE